MNRHKNDPIAERFDIGRLKLILSKDTKKLYDRMTFLPFQIYFYFY
jgi:hypothetical protein